ncbi:MAG: hypothetical protein IJ438_09130 [Clostridia bacterium]|nr:hypothetical protein [Clostridia bacterium]
MPDDKGIRKFLWISYFHDGQIKEILFATPKPKDITLRIYSCHDGFTYLLRFHRVQHFECSTPVSCWHEGEEISGTVFKDTALLHRLQKEEGTPLYHLRISLWTGYLDAIFPRVTIRREGGRVSYKSEIPPEAVDWGNRWCAPNCYFYLNHDPFQVDLASITGDDSAKRDEQIDDVLWARLYYLHRNGNVPDIVAQARSIAAKTSGYWHAELYATVLLGKHGSPQDLPALTVHYLCAESTIRKRVILDAMELIQERTGRKNN